MKVAGFDIGGANTDLAVVDFENNEVKNIEVDFAYLPMWSNNEALPKVLTELIENICPIDEIDAVGISMTAELVDAYDTKKDGVLDVVKKCEETFECPTAYVGIDGMLSKEEIEKTPLKAAAANWIATAQIATLISDNCIFIDTGSTTTDIIPIKDGKECAIGRSDFERLATGELVYTGTLRTNLAIFLYKVQLHGKELSYNNIGDTDGALETLKEFEEPTVVAAKHANPCGVGSAATLAEAFKKAYEADPVSIFGGIIAVNREVDKATAEIMSPIFLEVIVAPSFSEEALAILTKKKNLRLLQLSNISKRDYTSPKAKTVLGGLLIQDMDQQLLDGELKYVTQRRPSEKELEDLLFALKVVKHTKSNAIAIAKDKCTTGVGPGQVSRIWALENAIRQGGDRIAGSVMASDAFFPFADCVEAAHKAGITAIIQPGGSIHDQDSIDAANKYNIAMIFTGMRHFKH